jgi:hypothetical protein
MRARSVFAVVAALLALPSFLSAQASKAVPSVNFKPSMLDTKDGSGTVLGAEYDAKVDWKYSLASDRGSNDINPDVTLFRLGFVAAANGAVAIDKRRNPKNFSEGKVEGAVLWSNPTLALSAGPRIKFETDQSFQNKAFVIAGSVTGMVCKGLTHAGCFVADVSYDNVDPKNDKERSAVLGSTREAFKRVSLELLYKQEFSWKAFHGLELNYRLFQELNAPAAVEIAKLDMFNLATIRLDLPSDFFVAYSAGKLPFDRKDDAIVQLGWSYKLW